MYCRSRSWTGAAAAVPSASANPQVEQNFASGVTSELQFGQTVENALPQLARLLAQALVGELGDLLLELVDAADDRPQPRDRASLRRKSRAGCAARRCR